MLNDTALLVLPNQRWYVELHSLDRLTEYLASLLHDNLVSEVIDFALSCLRNTRCRGNGCLDSLGLSQFFLGVR